MYLVYAFRVTGTFCSPYTYPLGCFYQLGTLCRNTHCRYLAPHVHSNRLQKAATAVTTVRLAAVTAPLPHGGYSGRNCIISHVCQSVSYIQKSVRQNCVFTYCFLMKYFNFISFSGNFLCSTLRTTEDRKYNTSRDTAKRRCAHVYRCIKYSCLD
jgi:hypothetical protein